MVGPVLEFLMEETVIKKAVAHTRQAVVLRLRVWA
jgi:hypothetical protein